MKLNRVAMLTAVLFFGANLLNAKVVDSTVATVNGQAILSSQYNGLVTAIMEEYKAKSPKVLEDPANVNTLKQEVLNQLITDALLTQTAKNEGIKVKDSELAEGINEIKARFAIDPTTGQKIDDQKVIDNSFNAELKKEGMTYKQFEDKIREQIAVRKLIDSVVKTKVTPPTKEQIDTLYEDIVVVIGGNENQIKAISKDRLEMAVPLAAKLNQLTAEQIRISPVFVKLNDNTPEELKAKEKVAKEARKEMKKGDKPMVEIIEKYSDDKTPLATNGEMILIRGVMPKDFDTQIFAVNVGDVSNPIKTEQGLYVIKVQEKKAKKEFTQKQIEPDLTQYLAAVEMQKAMVKYLTSLKEKSNIKVMVKLDNPAPSVAPTPTETTKPASDDKK